MLHIYHYQKKKKKKMIRIKLKNNEIKIGDDESRFHLLVASHQ